jgi:hypothetical protein
MAWCAQFAMAYLEDAARRSDRLSDLVLGSAGGDWPGKAGAATADVQKQHLGCAGRAANGINTVRLAYVCEHAGHALIDSR